MTQTCITPRPRAAQPVIDWLRHTIQAGGVGPDQLLCTELDLVRRFKVSRATVRRALEEQEQRGLIQRRAGRGVFVRKTLTANRMIQVIVPSLANDMGIAVARAAQRCGVERGNDVMVYDAQFSLERDIDAIARLPRERFDGAIIVSLHHPRVSEMFLRLKVARFPFVVVDQRLEEVDVPTVTHDNYGGAYAMAQELMRRGHRRIGYIGPVLPSTRFRLEGLRDAVNDAGIAFDRTLVGDLALPDLTLDSREAVSRCVCEIMSRGDLRPTALVVHRASDLAIVYQALRGMGLTIGRDVSVVSFGEPASVATIDPLPTLVRVSFAEMGTAAMEMLDEIIKDPDRPIEHRVLPTQWVEGASVESLKRNRMR